MPGQSAASAGAIPSSTSVSAAPSFAPTSIYGRFPHRLSGTAAGIDA